MAKNPKKEMVEVEVVDSEKEEVASEAEAEATAVEAEEEGYVDKFEVDCGGFIDSSRVVSIKMPKIEVELVNGAAVVKRDPIGFIIEDSPSACANLCKIAAKGFPHLTISVHTGEETENSAPTVWKFDGARIKIIDYGVVVSVPQPDKRVIQCEVEYKRFSVDGVEV